MAKILMYADMLCNTGFAHVSHNIIKQLKKDGHTFVGVGINYRGEPKEIYYPGMMDVTVFPTSARDPLGKERILNCIDSLDYDILFVIGDVFNLFGFETKIKEIRERGKKTVLYFPVDASIKKEWITVIESFDVAVTYTQFAHNECSKFGLDIPFIYHGYDDKIYYDRKNKDALRAKYFPFIKPTDRLFINVNINQPRKDLPTTIEAFAEYFKGNPNSYLYMHCNPVDLRGINLEAFILHYHPHLINNIIFPDKNDLYTDEMMAELYNCADLLVSSTLGEGWGLSCLTPDNMIKTIHGYKKIQDIGIGEYVFTSKGYKQVYNINNKIYNGKIIDIKIKQRPVDESLKLTPEHNILTNNGWKRADEININDILYYPKDTFKKYYRYKFDLADICNEKKYCRNEHNIWIHGNKKKDYKRYINLNKNFAELLGIYLAEGSASKNGIVFSISKEENDFKNRIITLVKKVWGLDCAVEDDIVTKKRWIRVYGNIIKEFYKHICGSGARNKNIKIIDKLTKHTASKILKGFWTGDGSIEPTGYEMTTCSKQLAYDLCQLADKLGMRLTIEHNIKRNSYRLRTNTKYAYNFSMILNSSRFEKYGIGKYNNEIQIDKITNTEYNGIVYDLSVIECPEFLTSNGIVHNCTEALACGTRILGPDNTSVSEIINEFGGLKISTRGHRVNTYDNSWARPITDYVDMAEKMGADYDEFNYIKGDKLSEITWDKIGLKWRELIKNI